MIGFDFQLREGYGVPRSPQATWRDHMEAALAHDSLNQTTMGDYWTQPSSTILTTLVRGPAGFACINDYLFRQSDPWELEDLTQIDTWFIGVLVHTDHDFKRRVEKHIESYRSPYGPGRRPSSEDTVNKFLNVRKIVAQLVAAPKVMRISFLETVSASGTSTMLKPFLDEGIDINDGRYRRYLHSAVVSGNLDTFQILLAHANTNMVLPGLLSGRHARTSTLAYVKYCMASITEMITYVGFRGGDLAPMHAFLPKIEGASQVLKFLNETEISTQSHPNSDAYLDTLYMWFALTNGEHRPVQFFLGRENLTMNAPIEYKFKDGIGAPGGEGLEQYTWLTYAVAQGHPSCVKLLARCCDVTVPDRAGRTAIGIARDCLSRGHQSQCYKEILAILEEPLPRQPESASVLSPVGAVGYSEPLSKFRIYRAFHTYIMVCPLIKIQNRDYCPHEPRNISSGL